MNRTSKIIMTLIGLALLVGLGVVLWRGPAIGLAQLVSPLGAPSSGPAPAQSPLQPPSLAGTSIPSSQATSLPPIPLPTPRITPTSPTPPEKISTYDSRTPLRAGSITLAAERHFDMEQPTTFHSWSPDGEWILFSQTEQPYTLFQSEDGKAVARLWPDLWVMAADGTDPRKLADWGGTVAWSPDRQSVAYIAPARSEGIEGKLYVIALKQSKPREIAGCDIGRTFDLFWLHTDEIVCRQNGVMYAIKSNGSRTRQLNRIFTSDTVHGPSGETLPPVYQGYYRISPNGEKMAYTKTGLPPTFWIANLDGTNPVEVKGNHHVSVAVAAWSPDSSRLAYTVYNGNGRLGTDIWIINADGSNAHPVAVAKQEDAQCLEPTWSPDGRVIAYTYRSNLPSEPESVWVVNIDGSEAHLLVDLASAPHWSPKGNEIAVLRRPAIFDEPESLLLSVSLGQ